MLSLSCFENQQPEIVIFATICAHNLNLLRALIRPVFLLVPFLWSLFCLHRKEKQWLYTSLLLFLFKWLSLHGVILLAIPIHSCIYCSIHSDLQNPRSPVAPCNLNCSCSLAYINPVCGQDKLTYFSACHAGCTKVTGSKVRNTSDLGPVSRKSQELLRPEKPVVKLQSACFKKTDLLTRF